MVNAFDLNSVVEVLGDLFDSLAHNRRLNEVFGPHWFAGHSGSCTSLSVDEGILGEICGNLRPRCEYFPYLKRTFKLYHLDRLQLIMIAGVLLLRHF